MLQMYQAADRKAKMTLIGVCLMKFAGGLSLIWGSCNVYFFSYLKHHGEYIDSTTNSKLLLWALVPLLITVPIANPFSRWIGYQNAIRICALLFFLSPMVINLVFNTLIFTIFWMIIPITCFCMSGIPLINCLWTQFPKDLNKVSGLAILMFSVGIIVWNLLFMMAVNPDNAPASLDQNNIPIFPEEVANNIFKASNVMFTVAGAINIIGSFLVSRKEKNNLEEAVIEKQGQISQIGQDDVLLNLQRAVSVSKDSLNKEHFVYSDKVLSNSSPVHQDHQSIMTLKEALTDKKFILVFLISGLNPVYLVYLMQNIKLIYMPIINDDHFLSYCSALVTVSAVIGAPFWGYLGDIKGFKTTFLLIAIVDSFVKVFGILSHERWSLALLFLLLGANDRGLLTVVGPGLISMFGIEMATQLIPFKGLALILSYVTAPIIQILFSQINQKSFLYIFLGCSILGVLLSAYLKFKVHYKHINPSQEGKQLKIIQKKSLP